MKHETTPLHLLKLPLYQDTNIRKMTGWRF